MKNNFDNLKSRPCVDYENSNENFIIVRFEDDKHNLVRCMIIDSLKENDMVNGKIVDVVSERRLFPLSLYNVNNFSSVYDEDETISIFQFRNDKGMILPCNPLEVHEIYMPAIIKKCYEKPDELTEEERYHGILGTTDLELANRLAGDDAELKELVKTVVDFKKNKKSS